MDGFFFVLYVDDWFDWVEGFFFVDGYVGFYVVDYGGFDDCFGVFVVGDDFVVFGGGVCYDLIYFFGCLWGYECIEYNMFMWIVGW